MKNKILLGLVIAFMLLSMTFMVSAADVSYSDSYLPKERLNSNGEILPGKGIGFEPKALHSFIIDKKDKENKGKKDLLKSKYPKVSINTDTFLGIFGGDPIIDLEIIDHSEYCTIDCYSILNVDVYQNTELVDSLNTKVYSEGKLIDVQIPTKIYILKNVTKTVQQKKYEIECTNITRQVATFDSSMITFLPNVKYDLPSIFQQFSTTKVIAEQCLPKEVGVEDFVYFQEEFVEYDNSELLPGNYIVKIEGKKTAFNQIVDWVPTIQNEQITRLAWWNITDVYGTGALGDVYLTTSTRNFGSMSTPADYTYNTGTNTFYIYTDRVYNFNSLYVGPGVTLSTLNNTGAAVYLLGKNNITIQGTVTLSGVLRAGQTNGTSFSYLGDAFTTPSVGIGGAAYGANITGWQMLGFGGGGSAGTIAAAYCPYTSGLGSNGSATPGSAGGGGTASITRDQTGCRKADGGSATNPGSAGGGGAAEVENLGGSTPDRCTGTATGGGGGGAYGQNGGSGSAPQPTSCYTGSYGHYDFDSRGVGGGGSGGSAGKPGLNLVLRANTLTISNTVNVAGTNGTKGGNGGYTVIGYQGAGDCCPGSVYAWKNDIYNDGMGGGGGGGAGGGSVKLYYRYLYNSTSLNSLIRVNAGGPGAAGTFADGVNGAATAGTASTDGNITTYQEGFSSTTLLLPANGNEVVLTEPTYFTAQTTPTLVTLINATYYLWNSTGIRLTNTTTLSGTAPVNLSWGIPSVTFPDGTYKWGVRTCWTDGTVPKCEWTGNNTFTTFTVQFQNQSMYSPIGYEMVNQTFAINLTSTGFEVLTGTFIWDDTTEYPATAVGNSQNMTFYATINVPLNSPLGADKNHTIHWHIDYGGQLKQSPFENVTIRNTELAICNFSSSRLNTPFFGVNYRDEVSNNVVNATVVGSLWTYSVAGSPYSEQLSYVSPTNNGTQVTALQHQFCFYPPFATLSVPTANYQYGNSPLGYVTKTWPFRNLVLTNTTTTQTLYMINIVDSGTSPVTFQVISTNTQTVVANARVMVFRDISGTSTQVNDGYTDTAGTIAYYLSPITPYTVEVSATGCTPLTSTITPTNSLYNILINCQNANQTAYTSQIDGIFYRRTPGGGVTQPGTLEFTYAINSTIYNMTRVKFELIDATTREVLLANDSLTNSATCGPRFCYLTMNYAVYTGDNIKARYYVAVNGTDLVLLEGDAYWRFIGINMTNSVNSFGRFMSNAQVLFDSWGTNSANCLKYSDNETCASVPECKWTTQKIYDPMAPQLVLQGGSCILREDYNKVEFSRFVVIFFLFAIFLFILGRTTGYELNHPGAFVLGMSAVIFILSLYHLFDFAGLTPYDFFNQWIFFLVTMCVGGGYAISVIRRYSG